MRALLEEGKAPDFVLSDKYLPNDERPVVVIVVSNPTHSIKTGVVLWGHYRGHGHWDVGGEPTQVYAWKDWPPELTESELSWIERDMLNRASKSNAIQREEEAVCYTDDIDPVWSSNQVITILIIAGVIGFAIGLLAG